VFRQPAPPPYRARKVALPLGGLGQLLQCAGVPATEPVAFHLHPASERRRRIEEEALEKRPAVEVCRAPQVPGSERLLERPHVTPALGSFEADLLVAPCPQDVIAE
jgi:hypothetical protein